jgi:hypothetical protein
VMSGRDLTILDLGKQIAMSAIRFLEKNCPEFAGDA